MSEASCPRNSDYERIVIDIATGDTMFDDPVQVDEVRRHVAACEFCRKELEAYQSIVAALTPPPIPNEDEFVAQIAANVHRNAMAAAIAWEHRRRVFQWAIVLAAAAALIVASTFLWRRKGVAPAAHNAQLQVNTHPRPASARNTIATPQPPSAEPPALNQKRARGSGDLPTTPAQEQKLEEAARLRQQGHRLVRQRKYKEAEKPLRQALQLTHSILEDYPGGGATEMALYEEYRCLELLGDYLAREDTFKSYLRAVRTRGGEDAAARALVQDGRRLVLNRSFQSAGRRLNQALALCSTGEVALAAHVLIGFAAERERLFDLACSQYQAALDLKPPVRLAAGIYKRVLQINMGQRRFDAAIAAAKALCAMPEESFAPRDRVLRLRLLARAHACKGNTIKAVQILRDIVLKYEPQHTKLARLELHRMADRMMEMEPRDEGRPVGRP